MRPERVSPGDNSPFRQDFPQALRYARRFAQGHVVERLELALEDAGAARLDHVQGDEHRLGARLARKLEVRDVNLGASLTMFTLSEVTTRMSASAR